MTNMTSSDNASLLLASEMSGSFGEAMVPVDVETVDTWVWLAYDQLNIAFLNALDLDGRVGVVLIESSHKANVAPTTSKNWACCCPISGILHLNCRRLDTRSCTSSAG